MLGAAMPGVPARRLQRWLLGSLLSADLVLFAIVACVVPFQAPTLEYFYAATEFAATHRIVSEFIPIGYPALVGLAAMPTHRAAAAQSAMMAVNVLIALATVAAAWAYLRCSGTGVKATLALAALLSVYPDFLLSVNKVQDANFTALLLFAFLAATLNALRHGRLSAADIMLGLVLGAAVSSRSNLVLLLPVSWVVLWRVSGAASWKRALLHAAIAAALYFGVTTAVHGRPFLPHYGPYNLYAGNNEMTEQHLMNQEDSLPTAVLQHGITAVLLAKQNPDNPAVNDVRDRKYERLYVRWTLSFVRQHPTWELRLTAWKFWNMMRPDFRVRHLPSLGGWMKVLASCALPLWLLGMLFLPHPEPDVPAAKLLLGLTIAVYLLPFLVTVSAQRFRVPLDFLCWVDLGAMLVLWRRNYAVSRAR